MALFVPFGNTTSYPRPFDLVMELGPVPYRPRLGFEAKLWLRRPNRHMSVPFLACMAAVAAFYHLPPRVLPSIQAVEGGEVGLVRINANGSADLGVMQVNTIWIEPLARFAHMNAEAVAERLVHDPCFNIAASGAIMRFYLKEAHGNLLAAVGHYHSHTPDLGAAYRDKVLAAALSLFGTRQK